MAKEFAVFKKYSGVFANSSVITGLIVLKDDKAEIYGLTRSFKNRLHRNLLSVQTQRHMSSTSPLASIFASPYGAPDIFPISDQYQWLLDSAKSRMTGKPIKIDLTK